MGFGPDRVLDTPLGGEVAARLDAAAPLALVHALPDGERGKTLAQLERAAVALLRAGATRRSLVVALGGGAVTAAAGFLAATFMRGIPWIAVPTTLLGMVDAAIGGKTAVNLPVAKNAVGAFHPPRAVLADPGALATLPARELASGKGEVLKYGALRPDLLGPFAGACAGAAVDPEVIASCMRMKVDVVAGDPTEQGPRKLLNLGHTYGHGVEAAGRFSRYTHGESVAVGLVFEGLVLREFSHTARIYGWTKTECQITSSRVSTTGDNEQPTGDVRFEVEYRYSLNGKSFSSRQYTLKNAAFSDYGEAQRLALRYEQG